MSQHDRSRTRPHRTSRCRASRTASAATSRSRSSAGRNVVLAFYPGDNTPGCTRQMCSYRDDWSEFERDRRGAARHLAPGRRQPREVGRRSTTSTFPLLADTDKTVIEAYGVGAPIIGVRRSVFVVDADGIVRYADRKLIGATFVPDRQARARARRSGLTGA